MRTAGSLRNVMVVVFAAQLVSCAHVAPYERGRLAHRTMQMRGDGDPAGAHVQAVHEGAAGGEMEAASGCGCN